MRRRAISEEEPETHPEEEADAAETSSDGSEVLEDEPEEVRHRQETRLRCLINL